MRKRFFICIAAAFFLFSWETFFCQDQVVRFYKFADETKNLSEYQKDSYAGRFIKKMSDSTDFPLVSGNKALFVYYGSGENVMVSGDMTGWDKRKKLKRLSGTRLFFLEMEFEKDARFDYKIIVDGKWITDPLNRRVISSRVGTNSYFEMPEYLKDQVDYVIDSGAGSLIETTAGDNRKITIYKPNGFTPDAHYRTVYVADGYDYLKYSGIVKKLDYLIDKKILSPVMFVFVNSADDNKDFLLSDSYYKYFTEKLIPFIEAGYPVQKGKKGRFFLGNGIGALQGFYMIHKNAGIFDGIFSQSGALLFMYQGKIKYGTTLIKGRDFLKDLRREYVPVKMFLVSGVYENNVSGYYNFYKGNRKFYEAMLDNESVQRISLRLYNQGHSWGLWKDTLTEGLLWLLEY